MEDSMMSSDVHKVITVSYEAFTRNPDGSWTSVKNTDIQTSDRSMKEFTKSPEVAAAIEEMNRRWQGKLPFEIKWRNGYEVMHIWEK
jgi:hypothetical protein